MSTLVTNLEYRRPPILDEILGGGRIIVEASAGTGKTFTIEHLVVDLLLTGAALIDQILIVTFTEKATAELRSRIRAKVEVVLSANGLAEAERERLKDALFSFHHSPIHTIHSFCHRMLTELAFDSGMRFGIDLTSGRIAFHEAVRAELRERLKSDARVQQLVAEWLSDERRDSDRLENLLWRAHSQRYLRTAGRQLNQQALSDLMNVFDAKALTDAFRSAAIADDARRDAIDATRLLEQIVNRADGSPQLLAPDLSDFDFDRICRPKSARRVQSERRPFFPEQMPDRVKTIVHAAERVHSALDIEQRVV